LSPVWHPKYRHSGTRIIAWTVNYAGFSDR
jgi:hypothetical protein